MVSRPPPLTPANGGLPATPEAWLPNEHSLYRPRHSRRQRTALACALVFFLAPAMAFVLGVRPQPFENRDLQAFPSPGDGWGFFTSFPEWASDHLPLREAGVDAASGVSTGLFGDSPESGRGTPSGPVGIDPQVPGGQNPDEQRDTYYPNMIFGKGDWLYLGADVSNKCKPDLELDQVIGALQRLRHVVESSGRRFELVIAPDKSTAVPENLPADYAGKKCATELSGRFWNRVTSEAGAVDLRTELARTAARVGHPLYGPNDTHWTYEGGLTMTYALAEQLTPGVTSSWEVNPGALSEWPADLPPLLGRSEQREMRKYELAPDGETNRERYVASDFREPLRLTGTSGTGTIAERTGLIADSFTQFASPFLAAGFQDLLIVHAETVADDPAASAAQLLADREVVMVELAERNVAGGETPLLRNDVIEAIGGVLAQNPR
ncbi:alginate O-acetyltransferase AlgX-related protein [Amycolatopsis marina]|uniref:alginate O-acetyltransferase AlgX-related protein n=1 Tax=Amycolatopsis marina TaxID=490629 RepID=UPI001FE778D9|nr:hypothetical protein [Amycolatopsis marina]